MNLAWADVVLLSAVLIVSSIVWGVVGLCIYCGVMESRGIAPGEDPIFKDGSFSYSVGFLGPAVGFSVITIVYARKFWNYIVWGGGRG